MTVRVDVVVFDLDDTLIDWWGSWTACVADFAPIEVQEALTQHVRRHCWEHRPDHRGQIWHRNTWQVFEHRHELWPRALPTWSASSVADLVSDFERRLRVEFFDEVIPTLDLLARQHRLAVLSNNVHLPDEAERLGLDRWFEVCMVAEPFSKPHRRAFLDACIRLGSTPANTWYVGDSIRADALGAHQAGLVPVWVDRFGDQWNDRPAGVHRVESLAELVTLLG